MITYKKIGIEAARLANQMSQYAAVLGLAYKKGYNFAIPYENQNIQSRLLDMGTKEWIPVTFRVPEGFKITAPQLKNTESMKITNEYDEITCGVNGFNPKFFDLPDNTNLSGFFQCEKYWLHISDVIRKEFEFKDEFYDKAAKANESLRKIFKRLVSIHIRRGDYVGIQEEHPVLPADYYQEAVGKFADGEYGFLVFSDDIQYCKKMFGEDPNILYSEHSKDFTDMAMMSMCDHNIIANSTFSWWAAWLNSNPDKRVIAPSIWLGPKIQHLQTNYLYCEGWEVI